MVPLIIVYNTNPIRVGILTTISGGILDSSAIIAKGDNTLKSVFGDSVNDVPEHCVN